MQIPGPTSEHLIYWAWVKAEESAGKSKPGTWPSSLSKPGNLLSQVARVGGKGGAQS